MKIKSSKNQYEMQDPTRQYPRPEFPDQTQSPPGLAREMDPKPDHGEESYQGFGRLKGRKASSPGRIRASDGQPPSHSLAKVPT